MSWVYEIFLSPFFEVRCHEIVRIVRFGIFLFFWFSSSLFKSFRPKTAQNVSLFEIHN